MKTQIRRQTRTRDRSQGYTILEVTIAVGLVFLLLGTMATVFPALTGATVETQLFLQAQVENDKARLSILNDLQTTDSTRSDSTNVPYFQIVDQLPGTANAIQFRKAEGFDVNSEEDIVQTRFSAPIEYWVNSEGHLVRTEGGQPRVVATRVSGLQFGRSVEGTITVRITTFYEQDGERNEVDSEMQVIPRNVLKM